MSCKMCTKWIRFLVFALLPLPLAKAQSTLTEPKVLDVQQYPVVFQTLTGVSPKRASLNAFFSSNAARFPQDGNIDEVTTSFLVGATSYASLFCSQMMTDESARTVGQRWVSDSVDFTKDATQLLASGELPKLLNAMAQQYWGRALVDQELEDFQDEITTWISSSSGPSPTGDSSLSSLNNVLISTCAVFLAAPPVWMELR